MGRISFFLKEAFGSLRRNFFMTIAALVTVFLSIVVLGGVLVFVYTMDALLSEVEQKVEVTVYFKTDPEPSSDQITKLQTEVSTWSEVKGVGFVSKEQALEKVKEQYKDHPEILRSIRGNPLPASLEISLNDPQTAGTVAKRLGGNTIVDEVSYGQKVAERLFSLTRQIRNFLVIFIALLGIVAILLISNTIRLSIFARKREVEIMKLVGATNWFIRWPFLIEGVFVGFVGALLASIVVLATNAIVIDRVRESLPFMSIPADAVNYSIVVIALLAVGIVIGAVGSAIGLRRFLKV